MKLERLLLPLTALAGLAVAVPALAQPEPIDVTLEVLDDVSEIDAVVMRLEDARGRNEERERNVDEARERDELERTVRDAGAERDRLERDSAVERDEHRELQNEEEDLEAEFDRERERDRALPEAEARADTPR